MALEQGLGIWSKEVLEVVETMTRIFEVVPEVELRKQVSYDLVDEMDQ